VYNNLQISSRYDIHVYHIVFVEVIIMSKMVAVRIPDDINNRLDLLAKQTGRTKTYYVREAILEHLDDFEDIWLKAALKP